MRPSGATVGAPSPMDWLTMSSEEMGDAQAPPGASFRAAAMAATPMCRLPGAACCLLCRKWHRLGSVLRDGSVHSDDGAADPPVAISRQGHDCQAAVKLTVP